MSSTEYQPLLPSKAKLSNRKQTRLESSLISDSEGQEDIAKGSSNVYVMTNNQKESADGQNKETNSSWDILHEALWRTPYIDFANEWVSTAMFNTKQFLIRTFNKTTTNSNNGRKFNMVMLNDENWSTYDTYTSRVKSKIRLTD